MFSRASCDLKRLKHLLVSLHRFPATRIHPSKCAPLPHTHTHSLHIITVDLLLPGYLASGDGLPNKMSQSFTHPYRSYTWFLTRAIKRQATKGAKPAGSTHSVAILLVRDAMTTQRSKKCPLNDVHRRFHPAASGPAAPSIFNTSRRIS